MANLLGLLAVIVGGAWNAGVAQTASFSYGIAVLGGGFSFARGVAEDGSGNIYVADNHNNAVKEMSVGCASSSCVTTLGGGFSYPSGVAVDSSGNVYVADSGNNAVKEMPAGCASSSCVTTLGGGFSDPLGVAVDGSGNVYVADEDNDAVKEMPVGCASSSCVTTLGGGFSYPAGVAVDGGGDVYVADYMNKAVKEMPAGCASLSCVTALGGSFYYPTGVAVDGGGNVYVVSPDGPVWEMPAGCASSSCVTALGYGFESPFGVAVGSSGNVYVADLSFDVVKEVMTGGVNFFSVPVGTASAAIPLTFTFNGAGNLSSTTPYQVLTQGAKGLDFNASATQGSNACNGTTAYAVGDVCSVDASFTPKFAGTRYGAAELLDGSGNVIATAYLQGTGVGPQVNFLPGTESMVNPPPDLAWAAGIAVDGSGNVYITDYNQPIGAQGQGFIYKETYSGGSYTLSTIPTNTQAEPGGIAVDGAGNLYVAYGADGLAAKSMILKETPSPGGYTQSIVANFTPEEGFSPFGIAVDGAGSVYVTLCCDSGAVYKETLSSGSYTQSTVVTGLTSASGIAVDGNGNVYVAVNETNSSIVKETPSAGGYTQSTIAVGSGGVPFGIAVDGGGSVYVAYIGGNDIGQVIKETPTASGYVQSTIQTSKLNQPMAVAVDGSGNVYVGNSGYYTILKEDLADPPSLTFATTSDGAISTDSPQTVTLENVGNGALSFPVPSLENDPGITANFTLNSSGESACPLVTASSSNAGMLAAGGECELAISFAPTASATGTVTGSLAITDTNLNAGAPHYATQSIQLQGTAIAVPAPAILQSPTPGLGTVLGTTDVVFKWTAGTEVTLYQLNLSAIAPGQKELFSYKGTALTATAPSLPKNGIPVYATLYSYVNGAWQLNSYLYTESGTSPGILKSPTPGIGTLLGTTNVAFEWTTGAGVAVYQLNLSAIAAGQSELLSYKGTATSATALSIPANGATVYATLYSSINGVWVSNAYEYTESGTPTPATLQSPTPGSTTILGTTSVPFHWSSGGGVSLYELNLSAVAAGGSDLYVYKGTATNATVPSIPANGVTVYATLYSLIKGTWQKNSYVYTESGLPTPGILATPTPGVSTILGTTNVLFQWSAGTSATLYQLNLSAIAPGESELYAYKGAATSTSAPSLPAHGVKVYARLYSYIDKAWLYEDYLYTEQ